MRGEKLQLKPFYTTCGKKGLSARAAATKIRDMKGSDTVNKSVVQRKMSLASKRLLIVEYGILLEIAEQQPGAGAYTLLVKLGPSQSII